MKKGDLINILQSRSRGGTSPKADENIGGFVRESQCQLQLRYADMQIWRYARVIMCLYMFRVWSYG